MSVIIFPGQGSQFRNMSLDFENKYVLSKQIFEEIEDISQINVRKIISDENNKLLNQTNYTQICIFAASIVIYKTMIDQIGIDKINPKFVMGHSLGEYTSLVANNVLSLKDASKLIKTRGALMNTAIEPNLSGMAAIIGKDSDFIENIIKSNNLNIEIANDNSQTQIVVSGLIDDIKASEIFFVSSGVKRYIKLNVSAAFHSKYMKKAQLKFSSLINEINFEESNIPIISNYDASINSSTISIINALKEQMANKVRWTESVKKLESIKQTKIIEIGPGKVLSGLISRISKNFDIVSINNVDDFKKFE